MPGIRPSAVPALIVVFAAACGGSTSPDGPQISVGGSYLTTATLGQSTCATPPTIEQHNTTVTHTPGATAITFGHAGSTYAGTLAANGSFTTSPSVATIGGTTFTVTIAGAFTITTLDAQVTVLASGAQSCEYHVRWLGPKQGPPNVLP